MSGKVKEVNLNLKKKRKKMIIENDEKWKWRPIIF